MPAIKDKNIKKQQNIMKQIMKIKVDDVGTDVDVGDETIRGDGNVNNNDNKRR